MKSLFYGIGLATLSGLMLGGALRPDLALDRIGGPQIAIGDSGRSAYGDFDGGTTHYPYGVPDYVVGTDHLYRQASFDSVPEASYAEADWRSAPVDLPAVELSTKVRSSGALWLSEVVATVGLLLVIHGCVRSGRANVVAFAVGVWIAGAYWFTSSTSFANPAVTIARTLSDTFAGIKPSSAPMFIVMQLVGAAIAYVLIRFLYPNPKAGG